MPQRRYVHDDEIGRSILPLRLLIEQKPWGKQYSAPLGSGQGRAVLTFHLHLFAFPDDPSPPLAKPDSPSLEKRFGKEIKLLGNIQPPANVFGILQVTTLSHHIGNTKSSPSVYSWQFRAEGKVSIAIQRQSVPPSARQLRTLDLTAISP
jgi:hypothetical protein